MGGKRLTEAEKMAIIAGRAAGLSSSELAERYGVTRQSIWNVVSILKKGRQEAVEEFNAITYRNTLRRKSYAAVEAGLDDPTDNYKRGNLGVSVLKGTGDLAPETSITFNTLVALAPADILSDYISNAEFVGSPEAIDVGPDD